jgi:pyruvate-ferredoxin/flavodoxin oxidoreductase
MKGKIAQRFFTDQAAIALEAAMGELAAATGRRYGLIERYRMDDARFAIVAMGSMAETAMATVDYIRRETGLACGVVNVTCFRPFPGAEVVRALADCKGVAIIERMDDPFAGSNPLTAEVKAAFVDALTGDGASPSVHRIPEIFSGSAGLGSRDVRPADFIATFTNMAEHGPRRFFLGIPHPQALERKVDPDIRPVGAFSMRGYSVGGYGSVTTNKVIATILGDAFGFEVQAYPRYGSEKKGLPTTYYLTAATERVRTHCELDHVEFVPLNNIHAFSLGNPLIGASEGGTIFVQSSKNDPKEVWASFPHYARRVVRQKHMRVLYLDGARIAADVTRRPDLQIRMQGIVLLGVFLRAMPWIREQALDEQDLFSRVETALQRYFGRVGEQVVHDNLVCVRRGFTEVQEIPRQEIFRDVDRESLALAGRCVADVMTSDVITCRPDATLPEVAATLHDRDISAIVVIDAGGELAGVLSSTDLRRAQFKSHTTEPHAPQIKTAHLMSRDIMTTWPEEPLEAAATRLFDNHVHRLVVTASPEDRHPVGIISMTDLADLIEKESET